MVTFYMAGMPAMGMAAMNTTTKLTDVYDYGDHVLIAQTALFKSPGGVDPVIVGFNLREGDEGS